MTARDEIIAAMRSLAAHHGRQEFKLEEIVYEVFARGSKLRESTIRTHVTSRMCKDAPDHHAVVYRDLERTRPGWYRLIGM